MHAKNPLLLSLFGLGLLLGAAASAQALAPLMADMPGSRLAGGEPAERALLNGHVVPPRPAAVAAERAADECPQSSAETTPAAAPAPDASSAEHRVAGPAAAPERATKPQRGLRWKALLPGTLK